MLQRPMGKSVSLDARFPRVAHFSTTLELTGQALSVPRVLPIGAHTREGPRPVDAREATGTRGLHTLVDVCKDDLSIKFCVVVSLQILEKGDSTHKDEGRR